MLDAEYLADLRATTMAEIGARQHEARRLQVEIAELHKQLCMWFGAEVVLQEVLADVNAERFLAGLLPGLSYPQTRSYPSASPAWSGASNLVEPRAPGWWESIGIGGIFKKGTASVEREQS